MEVNAYYGVCGRVCGGGKSTMSIQHHYVIQIIVCM